MLKRALLAALSLGAVAAAVSSTLPACKSTGDASQVREADGTQGAAPASGPAAVATVSPGQPAAFPTGSACGTACADTASESSWAVCYSCRCKAAMDNYLPKASEISCANGAELKVYRLEGTGTDTRMTPVTGEVPDCMNPDRLREGCHPGSRLVQIRHDDVVFKAICKRESFVANYNDLNIIFEESGFIGHNARTGATCFWNDNSGVISGTNQPEIDLTDGAPEKVAKYLQFYYNVKDDHCTTCHDNDAFMYDTHLQSTNWITDSQLTNGPYHTVHIDGSLGRIANKQLVSDGASACTSCHRISRGNTCARWAMDSMGFSTIKVHQKSMHATEDAQWGIVKDETGAKWTYPYWMPKTGSPPATKAAWTAKFGTAMATIKTCCANPDASGCVWADIPAVPEEVQ